MQSANKNPPWARSSDNITMSGMGSGVMPYGAGVGNAAMYGQGMMQNQANMMGIQSGMAMGQMAAGMYPGNVVAYPTPRGTFGNQAQPATAEQRVFTGTVTKTHNDFGFVDNDVFYQTSVCVKGSLPKVNDRVLVEATYNPSMPFKWNATRVQVLTNKQSGYNAVPPPGGERNERRSVRRSPPRNRNQPKRARSRTRSPPRQAKRRDSPPRKRAPRRSPTPPKYVMRVPHIPLDVSDLDVTALSQRYTNLYVPSDFFALMVKWSEAFPPQRPFALYNPCQFHIMPKDVPSPTPNDAVLEPPDADYRFSAKVMLISLPTLESLYKKCGLIRSDAKERRDSKSALHPTRLIKFLVGQKGKGGDNFAIGGPWSPSLDGENPDSDPSVLVRTAIRTTKALTGIDLTPCTQWFRMVEFYYWREDSARLETVVLFLPDVWSAMPSRAEWETVQELYKKALEARLHPESVQEQKPEDTQAQEQEDMEEEPKPEPTHHSELDLKSIKVEQLREELEARGLPTRGLRAQLLARLSRAVKAEAAAEKDGEAVNGEAEESDTMDITIDTVAAAEEIAEVPEENKPVEETKEQLALREAYALPDTPHIVVHPSPTAKGGKFSCSAATLSLLLDYRMSDNKEHSFEIFVFAELFNEMLMRDFGFYIFRSLSALPEREAPQEEKDKEKKEGEKDKEKKEGEKEGEKKAETKDSNKAEVKDKEKGEDKDKVESKEKQKEGSKDTDDKKDKDEKKDKGKDDKRDRRDKSRDRRRERSAESERSGRGVDLPADPYLLLSLAYFDTYRCNYVLKRDLTALFTALGLRLSRSQLRHVLDKVCIKENFNYKPLASAVRDLTGAAAAGLTEPDDATDAVIKELASGNRNLLPVFGAKKSGGVPNNNVVGDNGMVTWQGRLVDIGASLAALDRSERRANRLEAALDETKDELYITRSVVQQHSAAIASLQQQLEAGAEELGVTKKRLTAVTASSKLFKATLKTIKNQVEAVANISIESEEPAEAVNGPKSESEAKTEKKEVKTEMDAKKPEPETDAKKPEPVTNDKGKEEAVKTESITDKVEPVSMDLDDK